VAGVRQDGVTPRISSVKAVVVDVGWVNGLAAIRSLGRAGIPVFAVDHRLEQGLVNAGRVGVLR
jgi:hypothetical protein